MGEGGLGLVLVFEGRMFDDFVDFDLIFFKFFFFWENYWKKG